MNYYAFDEPIEAVSKDGVIYVTNRTIVMSEPDAIDYWRDVSSCNIDDSDSDILDDFVVNNYAYKVEKIKPLEEIELPIFPYL